MNIGIFGNTNNYPYLLAKGMRALGIGVHLVINRRERLHRPENCDPQLAGAYPDWILDASDLHEEDYLALSPRLSALVNFLSAGIDAVVLNDIGPSLYRVIERPAVVLLTGSDLLYSANYESAAARRASWDPAFARSAGGRMWERAWTSFVTRQRDGILAARAVSYAPPGMIPEGDALLGSIGVAPAQRFFIYMADLHGIAPAPLPEEPSLRILNGARLTGGWTLKSGLYSQDDKRPDILLRGFKGYAERRRGGARLHLFAKGDHVSEIKKMVRALGLSKRVEWCAEIDLAGFRNAMAGAHIVCDQFGNSFPGMAALDAMAMGRPVLANFRLDVLRDWAADEWPVLNATSTAEVAERLQFATSNRAGLVALGERARQFAEIHLSPEANARSCLRFLGLS